MARFLCSLKITDYSGIFSESLPQTSQSYIHIHTSENDHSVLRKKSTPTKEIWEAAARGVMNRTKM